jgi:hypothetical protein
LKMRSSTEGSGAAIDKGSVVGCEDGRS